VIYILSRRGQLCSLYMFRRLATIREGNCARQKDNLWDAILPRYDMRRSFNPSQAEVTEHSHTYIFKMSEPFVIETSEEVFYIRSR
jgi:hypothetical protein